MANAVTFDSIVAARTRAAELILNTPDLLTAYEAKGGLPDDLHKISAHGREAEVLSQAQSAAQAAGGAATLTILGAFASLQRDYNAVMGVVQAVRHDLVEAKAPIEVVKSVDKILVNEAEVLLKTVVDDKGQSKKKVVKRVSQEALRAEIARDARALLDLTPAHAALKKRKVDKARLNKLLSDADALSGQLADRAAAKGDQKKATTTMRDAVSAQKLVWGGCYRLLAALGREDPRVGALLAEAARKRSSKKETP